MWVNPEHFIQDRKSIYVTVAVRSKLVYSELMAIGQGLEKRMRRQTQLACQLGFENDKPATSGLIYLTVPRRNPSSESTRKEEGGLPLLDLYSTGRTPKMVHRIPPPFRNFAPSTQQHVP